MLSLSDVIGRPVLDKFAQTLTDMQVIVHNAKCTGYFFSEWSEIDHDSFKNDCRLASFFNQGDPTLTLFPDNYIIQVTQDERTFMNRLLYKGSFAYTPCPTRYGPTHNPFAFWFARSKVLGRELTSCSGEPLNENMTVEEFFDMEGTDSEYSYLNDTIIKTPDPVTTAEEYRKVLTAPITEPNSIYRYNSDGYYCPEGKYYLRIVMRAVEENVPVELAPGPVQGRVWRVKLPNCIRFGRNCILYIKAGIAVFLDASERKDSFITYNGQKWSYGYNRREGTSYYITTIACPGDNPIVLTSSDHKETILFKHVRRFDIGSMAMHLHGFAKSPIIDCHTTDMPYKNVMSMLHHYSAEDIAACAPCSLTKPNVVNEGLTLGWTYTIVGGSLLARRGNSKVIRSVKVDISRLYTPELIRYQCIECQASTEVYLSGTELFAFLPYDGLIDVIYENTRKKRTPANYVAVNGDWSQYHSGVALVGYENYPRGKCVHEKPPHPLHDTSLDISNCRFSKVYMLHTQLTKRYKYSGWKTGFIDKGLREPYMLKIRTEEPASGGPIRRDKPGPPGDYVIPPLTLRQRMNRKSKERKKRKRQELETGVVVPIPLRNTSFPVILGQPPIVPFVPPPGAKFPVAPPTLGPIMQEEVKSSDQPIVPIKQEKEGGEIETIDLTYLLPST